MWKSNFPNIVNCCVTLGINDCYQVFVKAGNESFTENLPHYAFHNFFNSSTEDIEA